MSDTIHHECGIALIRLRKPLAFYQEKYGTALYGLNKMYLLLQKQHNRGQDGAGLVSLKLNTPAGMQSLDRDRSTDPQAIRTIFERIFSKYAKLTAEDLANAPALKDTMPFAGEVLMGHLRYGTYGKNSIDACHPFLRRNNWESRTLALAGNFNLTNVDELFEHLIELGQSPPEKADTVTVLERVGHFLDREVQNLFDKYRSEGITDNREISRLIGATLDVRAILERAAKKFDGGYAIGGIIGNGDAFLMRDPNGIRPAYYYADEEIVVAASERPAIQTAFNVSYSAVQEIPPAHALFINQNGDYRIAPYKEAGERKACSFERIYFSRGNDRDIYQERKQLGRVLVPQLLKILDYDFENTVFSYIPNTAQAAFRGMREGLEEALNAEKVQRIQKLGANPSAEDLAKVLAMRVRAETLAVKDQKLRTFITQDSSRSELVSHVYDVTYGIIRDNIDTLVLVDDSIVRGTTLRESVIRIVSRLKPKRIVVVSSAPQIRYPDCYGIDMSRMGEFVAFQALIQLLEDTNRSHLLEEAYDRCLASAKLPANEMLNEVQRLYDLFTDEEYSRKIAKIITPEGLTIPVDVLYQTLDGLHSSCPHNLGDWYFSGAYPTHGGNRVVNKAFTLYMKKSNERAY